MRNTPRYPHTAPAPSPMNLERRDVSKDRQTGKGSNSRTSNSVPHGDEFGFGPWARSCWMIGELRKKNQNAHAATNATASAIRVLFSEAEFWGGREAGLAEAAMAVNGTHLHVARGQDRRVKLRVATLTGHGPLGFADSQAV